MGIKLKELLNWLECNSILDLEDNIRTITVDTKKQIVMVTGEGLDKGEVKLISFSAPFDEVRAPVKIESDRLDVEERRKVLYDDETIEEEKDNKDEQIRNSEHKGADSDGKNEKTEDKPE